VCHRTPIFACLLPIAFILTITACSKAPSNPSPVTALQDPAQPAFAVAGENRIISILDECEPDSFNAAAGAGTCTNRNGGITFDLFLSMLTQKQQVPSWRFSPDTIRVPRDLTLTIVNRGGETHTFTEVAEFGGGIVPDLNRLSGTPVPAPECATLPGSQFIPSGGQMTHDFAKGEADKYQCCIHPWMRAVTK
jgi:hypothetical protein